MSISGKSFDTDKDDETLITEQAALDEHDCLVAAFTVHIMMLADSTTTSTRKVNVREFLLLHEAKLSVLKNNKL